MVNINHLDARSLNAPGGAFQGLVDAVNSIVDGYVQHQQYNRRADSEEADKQRQEGRQNVADQQHNDMHQIALAQAGIDPANVQSGLAELRQHFADEQSRRALDEATQSAVARTGALRGGAINPDVTKPGEVAAATEGSRQRQAQTDNLDAEAALRHAQGLHQLMFPSRAPAGTGAGTGFHHDAGSGMWFRSNNDGTTEIFDPTTKTTTAYDKDGKDLSATAPAPAAAPPAPVQGSGWVPNWLVGAATGTGSDVGADPTSPAAAMAQAQGQPAAVAATPAPASKRPVSLSQARTSPQFQGMTDDQIRALAAQNGRQVIP